MRASIFMPRSWRRALTLAAQTAVLGLLAAGLVTVGPAAPVAASHAPSSNTVHNCYTKAWDTAWNQNCHGSGAEFAGRYKSEIECTAQNDKSVTPNRALGETGWLNPAPSNCNWHAHSPEIGYQG